MRICHITNRHKPDDDRIFYKEARSLAKKYPYVSIISPYTSPITENNTGIKFIALDTTPRGFISRFKIMRELYQKALNEKANIYHCHEPESLMVAIKLKKALHCKIIFDSHELYPATFAQRFPRGINFLASKAYSVLEVLMIRQCDFVIGATGFISKHLSEHAQIKNDTIQNGSLPDILGAAGKIPWQEETIICHEGSLTFSRGLREIVMAIEKVSVKHKIKLKIVGDVYGKERRWLDRYVSENKLSRLIEITGWLDYSEVGQAISGSHIGIIAFDRQPNHIVAAPNKLFNYMHFGMPIVAPAHCVYINRIINKEECGMSVHGHSEQSYADAINYMIENRDQAVFMGQNAKKASDKKYGWPAIEQKFFDIYRQIEQ